MQEGQLQKGLKEPEITCFLLDCHTFAFLDLLYALTWLNLTLTFTFYRKLCEDLCITLKQHKQIRSTDKV